MKKINWLKVLAIAIIVAFITISAAEIISSVFGLDFSSTLIIIDCMIGTILFTLFSLDLILND